MTPAQLKAHRATLGYTQSELAGAVGVTSRTVIRWENGHVPVKRAVALLIKHMVKAKTRPE